MTNLGVMLLSSLEEDPQTLITNKNYAMSQKLDGRRVLIECGERKAIGFSRQGEPCDLPDSVENQLSKTPNKFVFDGELLNNTYWVFDIVEIPSGSIRERSWIERQELVETLVNDNMFPNIKRVVQHYTTESKQAFFERCRDSGAEGVVFQRLSGVYRSGRSSDAWKHKFVSEVDCVITDTHEGGRENLVLALYDGDALVSVGKVSSLTGDGPTLSVGDVCTVRCLYATGSDRLFHPTKPKRRTDKSPHECTINQLDAIRVNKTVLTPAQEKD